MISRFSSVYSLPSIQQRATFSSDAPFNNSASIKRNIVRPLHFGFVNVSHMQPVITLSEMDSFERKYGVPKKGLNYAFAGDNFGPADPQFLKAMVLGLTVVNPTYQTGGSILSETQAAFEKTFAKTGPVNGANSVVTLFLPTGTAANRLGLSPILRSIDMILASDCAHLYNREAGGYHFMNGVSARTFPNKAGKLTYAEVAQFLADYDADYSGNEIPKVISISQPTEHGTTYSDKEVKELADLAHQKGLLLQMDGSRLFYTVAKTGKSLKQLTTDLGVDIVFLGGSKLKMAMAEAVVYTPNFFKNASEYRDDEGPQRLRRDLRKYAKQAGVSVGQAVGQAAQFDYALESGHAVNLAKQATDRAAELASVLRRVPGIQIVVPVDTNMVLASVPNDLAKILMEEYKLMGFKADPQKPGNTLVRFMTNANTTRQDIESLRQFLQV